MPLGAAQRGRTSFGWDEKGLVTDGDAGEPGVVEALLRGLRRSCACHGRLATMVVAGERASALPFFCVRLSIWKFRVQESMSACVARGLELVSCKLT